MSVFVDTGVFYAHHDTDARRHDIATGAMTVAMIEHHDIDGVVSFDDDFDGVVTRLVPETLSSRSNGSYIYSSH